MTIRARLAAIIGSAALAVTLSRACGRRLTHALCRGRRRISGHACPTARALEALKAYRETYAQNPGG